MRRSRAPSIWPGPFFAARSWAGGTTKMFGFDLRQAQAAQELLSRVVHADWLAKLLVYLAGEPFLGACFSHRRSLPRFFTPPLSGLFDPHHFLAVETKNRLGAIFGRVVGSPVRPPVSFRSPVRKIW
jgi:hypothetical protein